jgi:hypothetical protein
MKKKPLICVLSLFLLVAFFPSEARGQFYLGFQVGNSSEKPSVEGLKMPGDSGFLYGFQGGLRIFFLALEGTYYRSNHTLVPPEGCPGDCEGLHDMGYHFLGARVKAGIPLLIVYPYAVVGYGKYSANIGGFGDNSDWGYNVGAGVEVTLGKIGLFGEGRYEDFSVDIAGLDFDFGGWNLAFGLNLHF